MTACNGCGSCCDPVTLPFTQAEAAQMRLGSIDERTREWVLLELRPLSRREGLRRAPWLAGKATVAMDDEGNVTAVYSTFYECSNLDPVTRQCTAYERRPDVCRRYPYQPNGRVHPGAALPHWCSFRADQGLPVEPEPDWQPIALTPRPDGH